jgi:hypothetical protein
MNQKNLFLAFSMLLIAAACGGSDEAREVPQAQPAEATDADIGEHSVHFSALTTAELPPEIARAYDIVRSSNRAMLTVSVIRDADGESVPAEVSVNTVNLTGQRKNVTMRRIEEGAAIYYVGETPVANQETLIFDISVRPEGTQRASEVLFKRQFFTTGS